MMGSGLLLEGVCLRGVDLSGLNLAGAMLARADLRMADVPNADLTKNLAGTRLGEAKLTERAPSMPPSSSKLISMGRAFLSATSGAPHSKAPTSSVPTSPMPSSALPRSKLPTSRPRTSRARALEGAARLEGAILDKLTFSERGAVRHVIRLALWARLHDS